MNTRKHKSLKKFDKTRRKRIKGGMNNPIKYVIVSTIMNDNVKLLKKSAESHGFDITILGLNNNVAYNDKRKGYAAKLKLFKKYLQETNDTDIILFTDAWDVLVVNSNPSVLLEKYNSFNKPIVFGAEKNLWPPNSRENEYADTLQYAFPYLNSGGFIGKAQYLKQYINSYTKNSNSEDITDDQYFWTNIYLSNKDNICLDTNAKIFLNLQDTKISDYDFTDNIFTYKETLTQPIFVHANGNGKEGGRFDTFKLRILDKKGGHSKKVCVIMSDNRVLTHNKTYYSNAAVINYTYAKKNGYDFLYYTPALPSNMNTDKNVNCYNSLLNQYRAPSWSKLLSIWDILQLDYDTIVYIDSDCIFIDHSINIDTYINNAKYIKGTSNSEIIFLVDKPTRDDYPCAGFIILKKNDNVKNAIKKWWNFNIPEHNTIWTYEQAALDKMINEKDKCIIPYLAIIDDLMFLQKDGQFIRHVTNGNTGDNTERNSVISCYYKEILTINSTYENIINDINNKNIKKLDTITTDLQVQQKTGGKRKRRTRKIKKQHGGNTSVAYVINLDSNTERWERIQKDFKNSSISLIRVSAVKEEDGALGCGKSFQKIVAMAKDENTKNPDTFKTVLIFEDDNMPLEDFDNRWKITKQWLDSNMDSWDIFNGGILFNSEKEFTATLKTSLDSNVHLFTPNYFYSTNWIYLNRSAYDKILEWDLNKHKQIDRYFSNFTENNFKTLCIYPFLANQYSGYSNIGKAEKKHEGWYNEVDNKFKDILKSQNITSGGRKQKGGSTNNDKICILMSDNRALRSDYNNIDYISLVAAINYNYAKKHNYDFIYYKPEMPNNINLNNNTSDIKIKVNCYNSLLNVYRSPSWSKLLCLLDSFSNDYNTIVYIDSDCAFVNPDISIDDYIKQSKYVNGDINSELKFLIDTPYSSYPCAGFIIIKKTENTKNILKYWWNYNMPDNNTKHAFEQTALHDMIKKSDEKLLKYYGVIDDLMFLEKDGQFIRHVESDKSINRLPVFTCWYDKLYNKDNFTDTINKITNSCTKQLDTIKSELDIQQESGGRKIIRKVEKGGVIGSKVITWIVNNYICGNLAGSETMAHLINKYLINKGYIVNVIIYDAICSNVSNESVNIINSNDIEKVELAINSSDILFSQNLTYPELAVKKANELNKPVVIFLHTHDPTWDRNPEEYRGLINPSKINIVYNSIWLKKFFNSSLNSIVLNPPINCADYNTTTNNMYVSLLNRNKGEDIVLLIAEKMPDVKFLIIGDNENKIVNNITYKPNTKNVKEIYGITDIVLMPSVTESWGMVATEAMCSGIPSIASPTEGLKENLAYAGLFIDRDSIDEWVSMIYKLKNDRTFYNDISNKCKTRVKELNPTIQLEKFSKFIDNILSK